ncbi:MAG: beta-xylosidase [Luteolibacter sp.]|uniref:GH39 family glycosyl hydrolase n=1 Tax=Luteolibacter sp. TaxID=1962973 RepID=UPI003263F33B
MSSLTLTADARSAGTRLHHHWNLCVGAGRANEGLRADWQEQMDFAIEQCGFKYVRFHGLFHDDMFVYKEVDGLPVYNFQYIDTLFDRLLELGIRPFVEFGFCPADLATALGTVFWWKGNGSPPNDYTKWSELIRRTVDHWVARYGIDEVREWYFEVWNEPNLKPFFRGTKRQYFELYRATVTVIKKIDRELRVGGPSTSNFVPDARFDGELEDTRQHQVVLKSEDLDALNWRPVWLDEFLAWCVKEKLPVDFVSCHPYPTDWALDEHGHGSKLTRGVNATPTDLKLLRSIIDQSAFPDAEIHLTEWNSSSSPRDFTHDFLQAATFIVKANLESIGMVDSLAYWTFTDIFEEGGAGDTIFHGGFGMINVLGIVKPSFHAYRMLGGLGDELLVTSDCGVVTRDSVSGKVRALAFHYPPEMPLSVPASFGDREKAYETLGLGREEEFHLELSGLKPGASLLIELLDANHGNAMAAWNAIGAPEEPTREQAGFLRQVSTETQKLSAVANDLGHYRLIQKLTPWSVISVREL